MSVAPSAVRIGTSGQKCSYNLKRIATDDRGPWQQTAELTEKAKAAADQFYATPLAEMKPTTARGPDELAAALQQLADAVQAVTK